MILFDKNKQQFYSTAIHARHGFLTRQGTRDISKTITATDFYWVRQVHGSTILVVNNERDFGRVTSKEADGLVYKKNRHILTTLSVRTADCVPILLEDSKRQMVGIVHCGWRGCSLNVVAIAIQRLIELGSTLSDITVAIGPAIGSCCYDIGLDRQKILHDSFEQDLEKREGLVKFNLIKTIFTQLMQKGICADHLDWKFFCTRCQKDYFTSYRREGKDVTNMISYISL